jgi:uncharacterized protein (DUF305 family)
MHTRLLAIGASALAATAIAACGTSGTVTGSGAPPATLIATSSVATDPHNMSDAMFASSMIPHHQQAIDMSDVVLSKQGIDPRVSELATAIKAAQGPEIQQMRGWLAQWGVPTMPMSSGDMGDMGGHDMDDTGDMGNMPGQGMDGMSGMSGMMSAADMNELQNAQGVEASRLYLTQMIEHHRGAITMSQDEIDSGQSPAAVALARSIITTQQKKIDTMTNIVASL